jgi:hypothetical protein
MRVGDEFPYGAEEGKEDARNTFQIEISWRYHDERISISDSTFNTLLKAYRMVDNKKLLTTC